jgi:alanine-synthesizing transaminase
VAPSGRLARQRDLAHKLLTDIPGVTCVKPQGALYMFPGWTPRSTRSGRPAVHPRTAAGRKSAAGAGQRLQLAAPDHFRVVFLPNWMT